MLRYNNFMGMKVTTADYRALAALRYRIRLFLCEGDAAARRVGLEPQQYLLLLALRGLPEGTEATVQALAERLMLKHNSTVELIDRLETRGYACRIPSREDRRCVLVKLLPHGEKLAERVARERLSELRTRGEQLAKALDALLGHKPKSRRVKKGSQHGQAKRRKKNRERE
ncbi:MAG TPA: MarR family transcriptional regulator [Terriglobales bacterium]|nr:MarR family transcriptional regulator [Terriglobales bacterium]